MDINEIMKQAQAMSEKMQTMQNNLANEVVNGKSGGGLVKLSLNGKGEAIKIVIDPSLFKEEEKEILEDLLVAAFNDAKIQLEKLIADRSKNLLGNISLPPGFKMPF